MKILRSFPRLLGVCFVLGFVFAKPSLQNHLRYHREQAALALAPRELRAIYDPQQRPYTPSSPWNTPIAADPVYDRFSEQRIATLADTISEGKFSLKADRFTFTVYYADETTPRHHIRCVVYRCTVVQDHDTRHPRILRDVPIPDDAQPSPGDDLMIVVDTTTGAEYGLYHPRRIEGSWEVDNAYSYSVFYDGVPSNIGARAAGLPYLAGLVRPHEIERGYIDHALAFGYPHITRTKCVYPASKLDDGTNWAMSIPLGARLQLNPALTDADFDAMGLNRAGKIMARAMQDYGLILVDYAGAPKIYLEDITNNPEINQRWQEGDLRLREWALSEIPYTEFKVLALPDAFSNPFAEALYHGDCYK